MDTRIVFLEETYDTLSDLVFDRPGCEGAAFVLCGQHRSPDCIKLIAQEVVPVSGEDFEFRDRTGLAITSQALMRITKRARVTGTSILFVHSHPEGHPEFSTQDDIEEVPLLQFLQARVPNTVHGTMVVTRESVVARLFAPNRVKVDLVLSVGEKFRLWSEDYGKLIPSFFDRQVLAFGTDIQKSLLRLRAGIVGLGGTGSPLAEQLYRLGVGNLSFFDGDTLEQSNLNRVYGTELNDVGLNKAEIAAQRLTRIGFDAIVQATPTSINFEEAARKLPDCDIIFGCTDKETPRAILNQVSLRYLIPVFDLGVLIDSQEGDLQGVFGRVTTLLPGEACLFCRGRISAEAIRVEGLSDSDRAKQAAEGYAPELETRAPAVIPFTSSVASTAVMELLHRMTGFMGPNRVASETICFFDSCSIRTNRVSARPTCFCMDKRMWGTGGGKPFLGMLWPSHTK